MSTKIYNAWKWKGDFFSLNQELIKVRQDIFNCMSGQVNRYLANKAYDVLDHVLLFKTAYNTRTDSFISHLRDSYTIDIETSSKENILCEAISTELFSLAEYETQNCRSIGKKDFSVTASIFPFTLNTQLIQMYIQDSDSYNTIYEIMEKHNFKEYSYTDQTDCPSNISEEEWKERCRDWQMIFSDSGIPKYVGYGYVFFDSFLYETKNTVSLEKILPYAKPSEERAYEWAKEYLENKALRALNEKERRKFSVVDKILKTISEDELKSAQNDIIKIINIP